MAHLTRRTVLGGALASAGTLGLSTRRAVAAPLVVSGRPALTHGVMSGDVTTSGGVVWARTDRVGRLVAQVGSGRSRRVIRGPWATPDTDHTAKITLHGLRPGAEYDVRLAFEGQDGHLGEEGVAHLRTAPSSGRQSFVWTGDTAGQGWGINPDLGGMVGYRTMHALRPDFFIHSGDTVYADNPISASVTEPDGQVWRNVVIPEVTEVAQTLGQFRGRHRYNMMDANIRAMYADVPVLAQWDDHETLNNWYPGEVLDDSRYTERRVDVLAARAKQAWREWQPIGDDDARGRRTSDGRNRIYRKVARGRHLDVFCLDMRTFKSPNTAGTEPYRTAILGREQTDWLIRELRRSRATWKVIAADLPLGVIVPDGPVAQESVANRDPGKPLGRELEIAHLLQQIKRHDVRNVLWVTADVHYTAAHHYDPSRAAFTDFTPFWELVAGPISAGAFSPGVMDATFGPQVVFAKGAAYANQSPRSGSAHFFGHVAIAEDGLLTAGLRDITGSVLWSRDLQPE
ncbi:alkaline phosphatase D family protein [Luteipulveratus flavus]|uniref:Alkaline phosphatase D family protein n=1 Tax=Luteipulveratus flavus TaxID=3031728 RepID=A0ABT6CA77_9MICO|nr:alkaline phosphatase D family protein [Luteipulveratus sp. YIM 133296]MDF8265262.1 alkaline phosphatase D family protein [Luteipulveratus sp. YIM 133296]